MRSLLHFSLVLGSLGVCALVGTARAQLPGPVAAAQQRKPPPKPIPAAVVQQKLANVVAAAQQYQQQPAAAADQLTLSPESQPALVGHAATVTATCGTAFTCGNFHYYWGDGTGDQSNSATATHTYSEAQSFTVYATAELQQKPAAMIMMVAQPRKPLLTRSNVVTVTISSPPPTPQQDAPPQQDVPPPTIPVVVTLRANRTDVQAGEAVQFTAALDQPVDGAQYTFNFGPTSGESGTASSATYTYAKEGTYQARVVVTSGRDTIATSNGIPITVTAIEPAQLSVRLVSDQKLQAGVPLQFAATVAPANSDLQYLYRWGDGSDDLLAGPDGMAQHTFAAGKHSVTVTGLSSGRRAVKLRGVTSFSVTPAPPPIWIYVLGAVLLVGSSLAGYKLLFPGLKFHVARGSWQHTMRQTGGAYPQVSFSIQTRRSSAVVIKAHPRSTQNGAKEKKHV